METGKSGGCGCCKHTCKPFWGTLSLLIGVGMIVCAIVIPPYLRSLVDSKLCDQLCIPEPVAESDPNYWQYSNWLTNDNSTVNPPEYFKWYFFNITNLAGVYAGAKPILNVVGPYTYQERKFKYNVTFSPDGNHASYEYGQSYTFLPAMSGAGLSETDSITTVNLPFIAGVHIYNKASGAPMMAAMNTQCFSFPDHGPPSYHSECLIETFTIREHLFSRGPSYAVDLGNFIVFQAPKFPFPFIDNNFQVFINCTDAASCHYEYAHRHYYGLSGQCDSRMLSLAVNHTVPMCVDSTTSSREGNRTLDLTTRESTGRNGHLDELGLLHTFFGNETLPNLWNGPVPVKSRNQLQFQTGLSTDGGTSPLTVWDSTCMRAFDFNFDSKQSIQGIDVLRYKPDPSIFAGMDPTFYGPGINGLLNTSSTAFAQFGVPAPAFGSRPYFAGGDPKLMAQFDCLNCPADQTQASWDTYFDVEPTTGKVLRGSKKVQVSAQIGQHAYFMGTDYASVQEMIVPLFWFEYSAEADAGQAQLVKNGLKQINEATIAEAVFLYGGSIAGSILVITGIVLFYRYCTTTPDDSNIQGGYATATGFQPLHQ